MWSHLRRITIAFLAISMVGACSSKKDENKNNPQKQEEPEVQNKAAISEDDNLLIVNEAPSNKELSELDLQGAALEIASGDDALAKNFREYAGLIKVDVNSDNAEEAARAKELLAKLVKQNAERGVKGYTDNLYIYNIDAEDVAKLESGAYSKAAADLAESVVSGAEDISPLVHLDKLQRMAAHMVEMARRDFYDNATADSQANYEAAKLKLKDLNNAILAKTKAEEKESMVIAGIVGGSITAITVSGPAYAMWRTARQYRQATKHIDKLREQIGTLKIKRSMEQQAAIRDYNKLYKPYISNSFAREVSTESVELNTAHSMMLIGRLNSKTGAKLDNASQWRKSAESMFNTKKKTAIQIQNAGNHKHFVTDLTTPGVAGSRTYNQGQTEMILDFAEGQVFVKRIVGTPSTATPRYVAVKGLDRDDLIQIERSLNPKTKNPIQHYYMVDTTSMKELRTQTGVKLAKILPGGSARHDMLVQIGFNNGAVNQQIRKEIVEKLNEAKNYVALRVEADEAYKIAASKLDPLETRTWLAGYGLLGITAGIYAIDANQKDWFVIEEEDFSEEELKQLEEELKK